jgi:hypothetical protein
LVLFVLQANEVRVRGFLVYIGVAIADRAGAPANPIQKQMVRDPNSSQGRKLKGKKEHSFSDFRNSLIGEGLGDRTAFEQALQTPRPIGPVGLTELTSRYRVAPKLFGDASEFIC